MLKTIKCTRYKRFFISMTHFSVCVMQWRYSANGIITFAACGCLETNGAWMFRWKRKIGKHGERRRWMNVVGVPVHCAMNSIVKYWNSNRTHSYTIEKKKSKILKTIVWWLMIYMRCNKYKLWTNDWIFSYFLRHWNSFYWHLLGHGTGHNQINDKLAIPRAIISFLTSP